MPTIARGVLLPCSKPGQAGDCQTPLCTHAVDINISTQLIKQICFSLFIPIYQTYPILFAWFQATQLAARCMYCLNKSRNIAIPFLFV